jgi:hypothetical protein
VARRLRCGTIPIEPARRRRGRAAASVAAAEDPAQETRSRQRVVNLALDDAVAQILGRSD